MPDMTKEGNETASRDRYPFLPAQVEREGGARQKDTDRKKEYLMYPRSVVALSNIIMCRPTLLPFSSFSRTFF